MFAAPRAAFADADGSDTSTVVGKKGSRSTLSAPGAVFKELPSRISPRLLAFSNPKGDRGVNAWTNSVGSDPTDCVADSR